MARAAGLLIALWAGIASAQAVAPPSPGPKLVDLLHARNHGMGGAFMSLGYGAESVDGNPAALSLYQRYQIELSGAYDFAHQFGHGTVVFADSQTSQVALGISYSYATYGGAQRRHAHVTTMASSVALGEKLLVGLSLRHYGILGATDGHTFTTNLGFVVRPVKEIFFGASAHNLILGANPDITRYFVVSFGALIADQVTPAIDLRLELVDGQPTFVGMAGAEWLIGKLVPVRLGYQGAFATQQHYISAGVGIFVEGSGVDLSYRHELSSEASRLLSLTLKLQL